MMDDQINRYFGLPPPKRLKIESTSSDTNDVLSQILELPDELLGDGVNSSQPPNPYMGASSANNSLDSLDHLQPPPGGAQVPNPVLNSTPNTSLNSSHGQHTPGSAGGFAPSPHSGMGRSPHMLGSNAANSPSTNVVSTSADPTPVLPTVSSSPAHSISSIPPSFSPGPPSGVGSAGGPGLQLPPHHGMQRMIPNHIANTTPPNPNLPPGAGGSHLPPYSRSSHHMGGPLGAQYIGQNVGMRPSYAHKPNMYNNPMSRNQPMSMFSNPSEYSVSRPHLQPNMIGMDHFRGQMPGVGPASLAQGEIGPANDMQPGQQPRLPNASGSSSTASNDPEKRKLIQQQLVLLLHAHRCQQREREQQANGGDFRPCSLPHCKTMKNVLNHMTECQAGRECTFAHCASSRQIIYHWKNCTQQDCPVCLPLKNAALQRPSNNAPSFAPNPAMPLQSRPDMVPPPGMQGSYPKAFPDMYNPGGSVRASINAVDYGIGCEMPQSSMLRGPSGNPTPFPSSQTHPMYPSRPAMPGSGGGIYAKDWQREIDNDLRLHLIKKLVEAIYPGHQVNDPRIDSLKHYAVTVEKAFFETAGSREEYYQLLAERIYRIRKELDERRKLKKAQTAASQAPGTASVANGSVDPNKMPNLDEASVSNRESMPPTPNTNSSAQQSFSTGSSALSPFASFPLSNTLPPTPFSGHENKEKEKVLQSLLSSMPTSSQQPISSSIQPPVSSSIQAPTSSIKDSSYPPPIPVSTSSQPTSVSMATAAQVPPTEPKKEPMLSPTLASVPAPIPAPDKAMPNAGKVLKAEPMESSLDSIPAKPVSTPQQLSSVPSVKYSGSVPAHRESTSEPFPPTPQGTPLSVKDKGVSPQQSMIRPDPTLVKIFTKEELEAVLLPVWSNISSLDPESFPFLKPVDPKSLGIPDYFEIVKQPIDLSCIKLKLMRGDYNNPWEFCEDVWLMFDNAWLYNKKTSRVYKYCSKLAEVFDEHIDTAMRGLGYCCGQRHVFHPQVLYCYGKPLCTIPRDSPYFGYQNRYVYCPKCFSELPGNTVSIGDDDKAPKLIPKSEFVELKNDAVDHEPFVECVHCKRKMHKICVLHHEAIWPEGFQCDSCLRHKKCGRKESKYNAKRLPTTKLGNYLQERVNNYLQRVGADAGEVTIRVVSSGDKVLDTRPGMRDRFSGEFPAQFPYRTKALFVFEEIDGVEVCFFGMHVQEYGSDCPAPNNRRVYISYLDSVHFFRPKQYRTLVYHEILVGYLEFVKLNGFQTAHIWACPPGEGDDYIFHCHPVEQKIPKPKRLVEWYRRMLDSGKQQRVVYDYKDIFRHCTDEGITTVTEIPYFEGDFWPNVIEETIKELDQEEEERKASEAAASGERGGGPKKAGKRNNNKKGSKKASGNRAKSSKKPGLIIGGDDLSQKIYQTMEKHKEVFFIVLLQPPSHSSPLPATTDPDSLIACDLMDGRDALLNLAREKHWEFSSLRRAKYSTMALLYELHTQSNDRFIYTCNNCHNDIETRYHCTQCEDYDLCERCYGQVNHEHEMKKSDGSDTDLQAPQPTAQARSDQLRKRVEFLLHAIRCRDVACHQPLCIRMKQLLRHMRDCRLRASGNCVACKHYIVLCATHARECKETNCHVPGCPNIKQRLRTKREQQQRQMYQHVQRRWHRMNATMSAASGSSPTNSEDKEKQTDPSPSSPRPSAVSTPGKGGSVPSPLANPRSVGKAGPKTPGEIATPKPTPASVAAVATAAVTVAQPVATPAANPSLNPNSQAQHQNPTSSYYPNTVGMVAPQPRPQLHSVQPQIHPNQAAAAHNPYLQHMASPMSQYGGYKPHHQSPMVNQGPMMMGSRPVPINQHPQMRYTGGYTPPVQHMTPQMYSQMPQQVPPGMMTQVYPSRATPGGVTGPMTTGPSQPGLMQMLQPQQVGAHHPGPQYTGTQSIGPPPQYNMRPRLSMQQAQAAQAYAQQQQMMSQQATVGQMPQPMRHVGMGSQHMNPVAMQRPIMQQQYMHGRPQMDPSLTADPSMYHQGPYGHTS